MSQYYRYPPAGTVTLSNYALEDGGHLESIDNKLPAGGTASEATLQAFSDKTAAGIVPEHFDEQVITYVGATTDVDTVTYKLAGSTVAVVTLSYDGSNRVSGVVKT